MQSGAESPRQSRFPKHGVGDQISLLQQEEFCCQHSAFEPDGYTHRVLRLQQTRIPCGTRINP